MGGGTSFLYDSFIGSTLDESETDFMVTWTGNAQMPSCNIMKERTMVAILIIPTNILKRHVSEILKILSTLLVKQIN